MATSQFCTSKTLYFFSRQHPYGHSLLKLDIAISENEQGDWNISSPQIIRHFSSHGDSGRNFMGCGKFGSKLYILGGVRRHSSYSSENGIEVECEYPLDVMVYDPAAPNPSSDDSLKKSNVSQMNFGKLEPLMFEVGGKLYVLGSVLCRCSTEALRNNTFEVYDPETNGWKTYISGFLLLF